MLRMIGRQILPACVAFSGKTAQSVSAKAALGVDAPAEKALVSKVAEKTGELFAAAETLEEKEKAVPEQRLIPLIITVRKCFPLWRRLVLLPMSWKSWWAKRTGPSRCMRISCSTCKK